ncbi:hypothetical protein X975_18449, partial [Stegodyphus mimosarum]
MGKANTDNYETGSSFSTLSLSLHISDAQIADLRKLDTLGIKEPAEKQSRKELEEASKEHFRKTLKRDVDGRYIVSLPWKEGHQILPINKSIAERRLKSTVRTLKNKGLVEAYESVFRQWLDEQIIEEVKPIELEETNYHYLPHRAVFKEHSTTKIRPVFDASAKEKNSVSLNDCLTKGPNYIELIPSILNKFRLHEYGVMADIRKAFLQIGIKDEDRDFLRFLRWEDGDPNKKKVFRHRRVVFGANSSPFLLGATLNYHLDNVPDHLQETASKLEKSMYFDNCVTSCKSKEELMNFMSQSKEIMLLACFDLRGWIYNAPLPEDRVRDALVFEVDVAGPLYLKKGKKAWILLFTCAVYLELIESLSINGFILGLRRFIARRGCSRIIYSDNGTNFVGTENLLGSIDWKEIECHSTTMRIQWKFNPPTASWWGGWCERLKKVLCLFRGNVTILYDIESVINSRPLTYLSKDPNDLTILTPSMFLQDVHDVGVPDLDHLDTLNLTKRYKFLQNVREHFRKRFRNKYLALLVQRPHILEKTTKTRTRVLYLGWDQARQGPYWYWLVRSLGCGGADMKNQEGVGPCPYNHNGLDIMFLIVELYLLVL